MIGFRALRSVACQLQAPRVKSLATVRVVPLPVSSSQLVTTGGVGTPFIWANAARRAGYRIILFEQNKGVEVSPQADSRVMEAWKYLCDPCYLLASAKRTLTKPMLLRMIPEIERAAVTQGVAVPHSKSTEFAELLSLAHIIAHEIDTLYVTCSHYVVGTNALLCQVFANKHERGARVPLFIYQGKTKNWYAWSGGLATPPRPHGCFAGLSHFPNMHEVEVQGIYDLFSTSTTPPKT